MHKMLRNFTLLYLQYFRLFISVTTFTTMYAVTTYVAGNITGQNLHIKIYKIIRKRDKSMEQKLHHARLSNFFMQLKIA